MTASLLLFFSFIMGLMNMLGGRFEDVNPTFPMDGRLLFRCLLPGIFAGVFDYGYDGGIIAAIYVWAAVTTGSALWFSPNWSFDEITGVYSPSKYPLFIRKIGLSIVPLINTPASNRLRGIIMKSMRGLYDLVTFLALYPINPIAPLFLVGTILMGPIYWTMGKLFPSGSPVADAEFWEGCLRGGLIGMAICLRY